MENNSGLLKISLTKKDHNPENKLKQNLHIMFSVKGFNIVKFFMLFFIKIYFTVDFVEAKWKTNPHRFLLIATSGGLNQQRTGVSYVTSTWLVEYLFWDTNLNGENVDNGCCGCSLYTKRDTCGPETRPKIILEGPKVCIQFWNKTDFMFCFLVILTKR